MRKILISSSFISNKCRRRKLVSLKCILVTFTNIFATVSEFTTILFIYLFIYLFTYLFIYLFILITVKLVDFSKYNHGHKIRRFLFVDLIVLFET